MQAKLLINPMDEINDDHLLNDSAHDPDEGLVSWVEGDVVVPVCDGCELDDEAVGHASLLWWC